MGLNRPIGRANALFQTYALTGDLRGRRADFCCQTEAQQCFIRARQGSLYSRSVERRSHPELALVA